jgi:nitrogen fixation/metabolism regulation signal transduction histidine kinase
MLAYSGKGKFVVQEVHLSRLVREMAQLLEVTLSGNCVLRYRLAEDLPTTTADAMQLRQVVMNLVLNAAEAVGDGGAPSPSAPARWPVTGLTWRPVTWTRTCRQGSTFTWRWRTADVA